MFLRKMSLRNGKLLQQNGPLPPAAPPAARNVLKSSGEPWAAWKATTVVETDYRTSLAAAAACGYF